MGHRTTKTNHKVKVHKTVSCRVDFFYYAFRNVLLVSVPLLVVCAFVLGLSASRSSARVSSSDNLAISVPSSCTLSSSVDETHSASIVNGTYEDNIGRTTLTTFCNDKNGYSVYAIGDSLNSEGNNTLVGSNGSNIISGTATSGDTSNWAMKLSLKAGDISTTPPSIIDPFTNYSTVPTYWTRVATIPASTTDMEKGSSFTTTYATYISPTQAAGTYLGQVKYLLTHPSAVEPGTSYFIMQEVADWEDELTNEGDSVVAFDNRDGKSYWVTKLADGHIWMTQNLDFDITANTTLSSSTTDLNVAYDSSTGQYAEYSDGYTESNGIIYYTPASTATTIDFTGTNVPGWQNSNTAPYTANKTDSTETGHASLGNYYNWTAAIASNNSSSLTQDTLSDISKNPKNSICPKGWRLPIAATNSNQSIYEFGDLLYSQGVSKSSIGNPADYADNGFFNMQKEPLWFVLGGDINNGILNDYQSQGLYWSNVNYDWSAAYSMYFSSSGVWLSQKLIKQIGRSIRCVAR